ncbi:unnamed protein product [Notodromas monacha]|uniref:Uncharacterized protein n=1 Tax=Notodromas monacha TaxID=399045 RepID=A0A7R9BFJ0_9CRUS|nr:unnamed protein product [Notodromas monacha]CAG0913559.1 unnamed protein product [Notodromas monacha]
MGEDCRPCRDVKVVPYLIMNCVPPRRLSRAENADGVFGNRGGMRNAAGRLITCFSMPRVVWRAVRGGVGFETPPLSRSSCEIPEAAAVDWRRKAEIKGPEVKSVKMGPISSPMGSVAMGVTYRTRLALSPHKLERSAPVMLKSDHFEAGSDERATSSFAGTTFARGDETRNSDKNPVGWFEKQTLLSRKNCGAFVDFDESSTECLVPDLTASFPWIAESSGSSGSSSKTDSSRPNPSSSGPIAVAPTSGLRRTRPSGDRLSVASSSESPPPEDFVVVSTSPPFASRDSDVEDLPAFYDALSVATKVPLLSSFDDQIESVEDQLKSLEFDKKEFDSFVNELSSREDMTVSEATAAEMSDEECDEPKKEERGGGGRLHAAVPMPLRSTSLWISC